METSRVEGLPTTRRSRAAPRTAAEDDFVDDYLPALLAQASQLISGEFHRVVLANGFSVAEWRVLATLAGGGAIATGRIARISVTTQPTVTRVLDRLEELGKVRRSADPGDRRVTLAQITPAGSKLVAGLIAQAREHEQRVLAPFGAKRSAALKAALKTIIALHSGPGAPEPDDAGL